MTTRRTLHIHLPPRLLEDAHLGKHNFIAKIEAVMRAAGYQVQFCEEGAVSQGPQDYTLFHMGPPDRKRSLTFRRVYYYPFWSIERSGKRWEWTVAKTAFDAARVNRKAADKFYSFWKSRLFGDAPGKARSDGFIYIPLQGLLTQHRSFQSCSPLEMIEQTLDHDPDRPVIATLHPKETYTTSERSRLEELARKHPRLTVHTGDMERFLSGCDYVVTQNSSAAFAGYFFAKPAVLFGQIDFHHIARCVHDLGARDAIGSVMDTAPDFAGYIHWFWQEMSINAGRPEAEARIAQKFSTAGWPMDPPG